MIREWNGYRIGDGLLPSVERNDLHTPYHNNGKLPLMSLHLNDPNLHAHSRSSDVLRAIPPTPRGKVSNDTPRVHVHTPLVELLCSTSSSEHVQPLVELLFSALRVALPRPRRSRIVDPFIFLLRSIKGNKDATTRRIFPMPQTHSVNTDTVAPTLSPTTIIMTHTHTTTKRIGKRLILLHRVLFASPRMPLH